MNKLRFNTITDVLLILLFLGSLFLLLRPLSPKEVEGDFFGVKFVIDSAFQHQIFGDEFTCSPTGDSALERMCLTEFEGQTLAARFSYEDDTRQFLSACEVTYGGTAVPCRPSFGYESPLPYVVIEDDLGVSAARFSELQAARPLLNWQEGIWMDGLLMTAVLLALLIGVWRWLRFRGTGEPEPGEPRQHPALAVLASLFSILLAYLVTYLFTNLLISLLFEGGNGPYWLSSVMALIGAGAAFLWRWQVWQGGASRFDRLAYTLAGGTTAMTLTYFFGLLALLNLGFVD